VKRNKKILIISHCLFNVNSKVHQLANYQGCLQELIIPLIQGGYGFIQLPCPEILSHGIKRWGQVKEQYDTPHYRKHILQLLEPILDQLLDYSKNGYEICGCIGVDGSPTCGVYKTCSATNWEGEISSITTQKKLNSILESVQEVSQQGILIEELQKLLIKHNLHFPFFAIDEANPDITINTILKELL
jgi:predicted secreted protein